MAVRMTSITFTLIKRAPLHPREGVVYVTALKALTSLCVNVNNSARADHLGFRQCFADLTFVLLFNASEVILGSLSSSVLLYVHRDHKHC